MAPAKKHQIIRCPREHFILEMINIYNAGGLAPLLSVYEDRQSLMKMGNKARWKTFGGEVKQHQTPGLYPLYNTEKTAFTTKDSLQELYRLTRSKAEAIMANNKAGNQQNG